MNIDIHQSWNGLLQNEFEKPYFKELLEFVDSERQSQTIFPPEGETFSAFSLTSLDELKVVVLGQDPYHDNHQAHGLAFSVNDGIKHPPSLRNIFKELTEDLGFAKPESGNLSRWANQGVLLLNTVLTVRAHEANSHRNRGWETFTDAVIEQISARKQHVVFVLWGKPAEKKKKLIDVDRHTVLISPHPSPLSASRGFFGSKPFSKVNRALANHDQEEISWELPAPV